jgi:hypothetical protein
MFSIPTRCPEGVANEIRAAFTVFWCDSAGAANHLRIAVEQFMGWLGIPARRRDKSGKYREARLHERIELFQKRKPTLGGLLMALKWLGNTGSHEGGVPRDDLLDAFEVFEHALAELIDRRSAKIARLARRLSKKHGPQRRSRSK